MGSYKKSSKTVIKIERTVTTQQVMDIDRSLREKTGNGIIEAVKSRYPQKVKDFLQVMSSLKTLGII